MVSKKPNIVFLPPNTTSHVQPLDSGIIAAFKKLYRKELIRYTLSEVEAGASIASPNVKQAIIWAASAWNDVSQATVINCWRKSGVIPNVAEAHISDEVAAQDRSLLIGSSRCPGLLEAKGVPRSYALIFRWRTSRRILMTMRALRRKWAKGRL
jgi:hypothetical protein